MIFGLSWVRLAIYAVIAATVVAAATWAMHTYNEARREEGRIQGLAQGREEGRAEIREQWREAVRIAQRAEDHQAAERRTKEQEADRVRETALAAARADADRSRSAAGQLRRQLDDWLAAARRDAGHRGTAAGQRPSQQGTDPLDLLADLFSRADREAGELAGYADQLRAAGESCERRHDAVTSTQ